MVVPRCWVSIDICCCGLSSYHCDLSLMCKWSIQLLTGRSSACLPQPPCTSTTPQRGWSNTQKQHFSQVTSNVGMTIINYPPVITIDSWYVHHSQSWVVYGIVIPTSQVGKTCDVTAVLFDAATSFPDFRSFQRKRVMLRHAGLRTNMSTSRI